MTVTVRSTTTVEDADEDGFTVADGDCDDTDAQAYPGATLNEPDPLLCYVDADGDGYGSANPLNPRCQQAVIVMMILR